MEYYLSFALVIIFFQLCVDVFIHGVLELFHGWKIYDYLVRKLGSYPVLVLQMDSCGTVVWITILLTPNKPIVSFACRCTLDIDFCNGRLDGKDSKTAWTSA